MVDLTTADAPGRLRRVSNRGCWLGIRRRPLRWPGPPPSALRTPIAQLSSALSTGFGSPLGRDNYMTEEHIRGSGLDFTFVRDNLYADFMLAMVGADGVIRGPAANGRLAAVAQDDRVSTYTAIAAGELAGVTDDVVSLPAIPPPLWPAS